MNLLSSFIATQFSTPSESNAYLGGYKKHEISADFEMISKVLNCQLVKNENVYNDQIAAKRRHIADRSARVALLITGKYSTNTGKQQ